MARCNRCGKSGLFQKVDHNGLCSNCASIVAYEQQKYYLETEIQRLDALLQDRGNTYNQLVQAAKNEALQQAQSELFSIRKDIDAATGQKVALAQENQTAQTDLDAKIKSTRSAENRLAKAKELLKSVQYSTQRLSNSEGSIHDNDDPSLASDVDTFLAPTVPLKFQSMNVRELRKEFNKNQRMINETLAKYKGRYTTKTNAAIYKLMVIALEAELQNVLYNIGYGKLEKATSQVKTITDKYEKIAVDGNQVIAPTIKKFIGEIEYLFIRAVEIEYEYYVQKERAKEEQRAIREQMRQEAQERKELERQRKHIEKEESKYLTEIDSVRVLLAAESDAEKVRQLEERIAKLQEQLHAVNETKEEILRLQTGKAGNVYIISNFGSFGENVFKIGMTRRLDPMDRVRELGSASVPFPFDVHSFVFSDDAVGLEASLHKNLHSRRVNRVNLRKEFFSVSINELEDLVYELEPTAEFNLTMAAEQYYQSQSIDVPEDYNPFLMEEDDETDEDEEVDINDEE